MLPGFAETYRNAVYWLLPGFTWVVYLFCGHWVVSYECRNWAISQILQGYCQASRPGLLRVFHG